MYPYESEQSLNSQGLFVTSSPITTQSAAAVFPERIIQDSLRDDIKSSGKFAILTRLKIEGGGGQRHITEKIPLKIQGVEDIDVKMTQNDLEGNRNRK